MENTENYQVRNEEVEKQLQEIGRMLKTQMPEGFGFTLMIFSYGEKGSLFYISSAMREDMVKTLEEFKEMLLNAKH